MMKETIASSIFFIVIFVAQLSSGFHLRSRFARQSPHQNAAFPQHQQQFPPFQQPANSPFSGPAQFSPPAQAFASKLAESPVESIPHQPHRQQQQQFVANNGPLIRAPDGQFVLAATPQQQFIPFQNGPSPQQQFVSKNQQQPQQQFPPINRQQPPPPPFGAFQQQQFHGQSPINVNPSPPPQTSQPSPSLPGAINNNNNNSPAALFSESNVELSTGNGSSTNSTPSTTAIPTPPPPPVDKSVDLDGDGALSLNEVQYAAFVHHGLSSSVVENLFNDVDHNNDGFLSAIEFNDIRPLVLAKAENAALRYLQNVDLDHNGLLSLQEAQAYILREYGISNRDVERIWRLVVPSSSDEMDALLFSKLRRRVRGMSIRLARQIMKGADHDQDGHVDLREAQLIAFEQEGIGPAEVVEMLASVDDNNDGQLNAPEFADFERIVRAKAVETSKKALKVVDSDGSGTLTMEEAKKIAFDHYGFDEPTLEPFFAQADENEDGQLDAVEFAGFRSVIRGRAVKNSFMLLPELDDDGDGVISEAEAEQRTRREDDMTPSETHGLFSVADQDRNGLLDKVELADFVRLVRLTSIKFVADHFRDYDSNRDKLVTIDELERLVKDRYKLDPAATRRFFDKVDVDRSGDLSPGEIVDFRHEVRRFAQDRVMQAEFEEQNKKEMAEIEQKLRQEAELQKAAEINKNGNPGENEEKIETTNAAEFSATTMNSEKIAVADSNNSEEEDNIDGGDEEGEVEKPNIGVVGIQKLQKDEPKNGGNSTKNEDDREEIGVKHDELAVKKEEKLVDDESSSSTAIMPGSGQNQTTIKVEGEMIAESSTLLPASSSSPSTTVTATSSSSSSSPTVTVVVDSVRNEAKNDTIASVHLAQTQTTPNSSTNAPSTTVGHVKEAAVVALDSIGTTTTKKLKKRRRKTTTTVAPTTMTTTTTLAPITEAAAEESYEDEQEEQQADGN